VASHYGIAPGGGMAPLSKLPNTAAFCRLYGCRHDSGFSLYQTESRFTTRPSGESLWAVSVVALSATVNANDTPMSNTINSGTILIEGNAFTAELLRFESEPWTRFYMAGEVIRESRKASGRQSSRASKGNSEAQVIEETECKTFGCDSATGGPSLPTELVKGSMSRKRWPSRARISAANSAFPQRNLARWPKTLAWMKQ
jgi:hypothetical protein